MDELSFLVQVSSTTPHCTVTIRRNGDHLTASCTCEQGGAGTVCRHRLSILSGQTKWVISDNLLSVKRVLTWVASTDIGQTIVDQVHAQKRLQEAKANLEKCTEALRSAEVELAEAELAAVAVKQSLIEAING